MERPGIGSGAWHMKKSASKLDTMRVQCRDDSILFGKDRDAGSLLQRENL
jgi:hypothetical protein